MGALLESFAPCNLSIALIVPQAAQSYPVLLIYYVIYLYK